MENLKKIVVKILDFIEVIMPVMALVVIFFSFIVNVVSRYLLNAPVNACYELCLAGLVWCLLLSSPYAARKHTNIQFTLIFDMMGAKGQLALRMVGNAFLIFCFGVMLYPCTDWVMFMARRYTAVLRVPMNVIYAPFIVFNVLTLLHLLYDFLVDVKRLVDAVTGKAPLQKIENEIMTAALEGGDEE